MWQATTLESVDWHQSTFHHLGKHCSKDPLIEALNVVNANRWVNFEAFHDFIISLLQLRIKLEKAFNKFLKSNINF